MDTNNTDGWEDEGGSYIRPENDKKERMNWNVWNEITATPVYGDGMMSMKDKPNWATGDYVIPENDKIIKVTTETVKCDKDHPAVWYSLAETGFAVCGYCNIKYVLQSPGWRDCC